MGDEARPPYSRSIKPPRPFDVLSAEVQGVHHYLRNHVNTELRRLHAGQKRLDRKLVDMDRRFNTVGNRLDEIDERLYEHDARFDSLDDSVAEILNLVSFMVYGGSGPRDEPLYGQTLWPEEGDDDETEEA